jgi:hypothetical protein
MTRQPLAAGHPLTTFNHDMKYLLLALAFAVSPVQGQVSDRLIAALTQVESNGKANAIGDQGRAKGILQVWQVVIVDVNRAYGTRYVHDDAFSPDKARDICRKYIDLYATSKRLGRAVTDEDRARIWNGGPSGWKKVGTIGYWSKVRSALK